MSPYIIYRYMIYVYHAHFLAHSSVGQKSGCGGSGLSAQVLTRLKSRWKQGPRAHLEITILSQVHSGYRQNLGLSVVGVRCPFVCWLSVKD
jgi:hypothetical protein